MNAFLGKFIAWILRFIWATSRVRFGARLPKTPVIYAMWHGQHFFMPFVKPASEPTAALISKHRDGDIFAACVESFGFRTIRGAGANEQTERIKKKGGVAAFLEILRAIKSGYSIALTADVPKISRVCGGGIIKIAEYSGIPIVPIAAVSHWRVDLNNWDKSSIGLPFSRVLVLVGEPIYVEKGAENEGFRLLLEQRLNEINAKAYAEV